MEALVILNLGPIKKEIKTLKEVKLTIIGS